MNVRKINLSLRAVAALLAVAATVVVVLGLLVPIEVSPQEPPRARHPAPATSRTTAESHGVEAFEPLWRLALRKPLTDAAAVAPMQSSEIGAAAPTAAASFVLLGTIGDSLAMIRTSAGAVELKGVGERANGARILAIRPAQVDVEVAGERRTLVKPREGGGG